MPKFSAARARTLAAVVAIAPYPFDALLNLVRSLNVYWLSLNEKAEVHPA